MFYIIVSCFTFLIFSVLLLSKIQQEHNKTILEFGWQNIEQAVSFNDASLYNITNYGYSMLDEAATYKLLYSDTYDLQTAIASRDIYDRILNINSMVTSLDFINFSTDTVLTKSQRMSLDNYYDKDLIEYLNSIEPSRRPIFYQPRESYVNGNHRQAQRVLSLIYYTNRKGALVINIDYDAYASQINLSRNSDNMELIILNQNKYVMAATNDDFFMQDFSQNPVYLEIAQHPDAQGSFRYKSDSGTQTILYQKDGAMGLTYISVISPSNVYTRSYLFGLTFRYSIVYIFVTLLLSLLASLILYRPVRNLKKVIRSRDMLSEEYEDRANDFEFFELAFKNLAVKNSALRKENRIYGQQREQRLLHMLLERTATPGLISSEDLSALDSSFAYANYLVFAVHVNFFPEKNVETDISLIKFVVGNVAAALMEGIADIRGIETITSRVLFLSNFETFDSERKERFLKAAGKMQDFFRDNGLFTVAVGFGTATDDLGSISASYEEARTALDTGLLRDTGCILFYDDLAMPPLSEQKYPYAADTDILAAIKNTNAAAADAGLDNFFEEISSFSCDQVHRHLSHLDDALQQLEYMNELEPSFPDHDLNEQPPRLLADYKTVFRNRCHADIQALTEIKMHSHAKNTLIELVQQFVADNIYNANLSVMMIAEEVNLSVNYLRNIYKENTGESLSTYITNRKLDIICELLARTDTPIQEISDRLGFATKNYFFTFFKKHTGMTPSQYRNQEKPWS